MTTKVGVIGLGAMGQGMAGSLRRAGFAVHFGIHAPDQPPLMQQG